MPANRLAALYSGMGSGARMTERTLVSIALGVLTFLVSLVIFVFVTIR